MRSKTLARLALGAAALTSSLALLPYWYGRRLTRSQLRRARRLTRVDAHISRSNPSKPIPATPVTFSKDSLLSVERIEATQDLEMLEAVLRDVRDMTHADEAIFWRWVEERDTIVPTVEVHPEHFGRFARERLPALSEGRTPLVAHPGATTPCPRAPLGPATLIVGPEGGFIPAEVAMLMQVAPGKP